MMKTEYATVKLTRLQLEILLEALEANKYYEQLHADARYGQINSLTVGTEKLKKAYETVKLNATRSAK